MKATVRGWKPAPMSDSATGTMRTTVNAATARTTVRQVSPGSSWG